MSVPAAAAAVEHDAAVRFAAVPGVLLPHMRLPPLERVELNVAGPCLWDGGRLLCPPDGLCFLYAWLAALSPHEWHRVEKDAHGFINDLAEEALWKGRAKTLLNRCAALMEAEGEPTMANRLKAGGYPGDEELAYYTRALGGAVLVTPLEEAHGFAVIHGQGPVQCEMGFVYARDGAGHSSGHYVLLRSWATATLEDMAQAPSIQRRRIRGKQTTPAGYPSMPTTMPTTLEERKPPKSLKRPAAAPQPSGSQAAHPVAKPRLPRPATTHLCHGRVDAPCTFSVKNIGERARYQDTSLQCPWCNAILLEAACNTPKGRGILSRALKFFWAHDKDIFYQACGRLPAELRPYLPLQALGFPPSFCSAERLDQAMSTPRSMGPLVASLRKKQAVDPMAVEEAIKAFPEDMREQLQAKLAMEPISVRKARARTEALPVEEQWKQLLQHRRRLRQPKDMKEEEKIYANRVAEDRARLQKKFFPTKPKEVKHTGRTWTNPMSEELADTIRDVAANDTGLPRAQISNAVTMLEDWCKTASWNVCANCYSLEPRHLKEVDLRRVAGPSTVKCRWCCKDGKASVPRVQDVPEKLRGLSVEIVEALRPFELDLGPYKRPIHGYREHTAMVRLLWSAEAVEDKVAALPTGHARKKARKAYKHLMHCQQTEYKAFVKKHKEFLRHHPDGASVQQRRRPLQQIEAPGLECALWPDLYYNSDRLDRQGLRALEEDSSDEEGTERGRGSVRRLFLKQVLGPILDYAGDYGLLQFVHDLAYWSELGAKRHIQPHLSMRIMLKGAPFTPAYWAVRHAAVLDLQRQCGRPVLFKTWAPYEWSAPYHRALLHQMESLLRSRTHLATLETIHLAHVLVELLREWVVGGTRKHGDSSVRWKCNVLAGAPEDGQVPRGRINFAARLEYQDGKRKAASQEYHGRGAIHLHAVIFAEDLGSLNLHEKLFATELPEGHPLRGHILDQLSYSGSGWPVCEEASRWNPTEEAIQLEHSQRDHDQGVRAYGLEEVDILKCHVDNLAPQVGGDEGQGLMLRYVATYGVKPSSEFHNELLADTNISGYGLALRVLMCLHPSEPEMVMSLFKQLFPDFAMGGTMLPIVAPWPTMEKFPTFAELYEQCGWRTEEMTLLEFLRKSNASGDVVAWLQKAYVAADTALDLGAFASAFQTFGEKVIAAEVVSIFNDKYFGQWLMLNVPFRAAKDLLDVKVMDCVPPRYQMFACAWKAAPHHWNSPMRIRSALELEAKKTAYIDNALAMIEAQKAIVEQYLAGKLSLADEVPEPDVGPAGQRAAVVDLTRPRFKQQQRLFEQYALERLDLLEALRSAALPQDVEAAVERLEASNRPLLCLGGPGTGKTFVADYLIRLAVHREFKVLYALPTGQLACRMRQRHPNIAIDTCHGAFLLYRPLSEAIALLTEFDVVVIDEVLQLSAEEFGRIDAMFMAAGKRLLLLRMGDEYQLPSIAPERSSDHPQWKHCQRVTLTQVRRCTCRTLQAKLDFLRYHKPMGAEGRRFVNRLCYEHKAWTGHHEPTNLDIEHVLTRTEKQTTFLTCTRHGASIINALAVQVLFTNRRGRLLARLPGDFRDNPENYTERGGLRQDKRNPLQPAEIDVYAGLRVVLARNINKEQHYVNGMVAEVEQFDAARRCLRVMTESGRRLAVYPFTDTEVPKGHKPVTYYPIRVGYAGTIHKYQGATLRCGWIASIRRQQPMWPYHVWPVMKTI